MKTKNLRSICLILFWCHLSVALDVPQQLAKLDVELTYLSKLLPPLKPMPEEEKLASDREVVRMLYRLAGLEATDWPSYQKLVEFVFSALKSSPAFAKEKHNILETMMKDTKTPNSFLHFITHSGLKIKPGSRIEGVLRAFFTEKSVTVTNARLKNITINLFAKPRSAFDALQKDLSDFFKPLFYTMEDQEKVWQFMITANPVFKEQSGHLKVDQHEVLKRIILTILVAQRPTPKPANKLTPQEKDQSDAAFYHIFASKSGRADRTSAFAEIVEELDWLRINPIFLKFDGMLCSQDTLGITCPDTALLTFLTEPKKVMTLGVGEVSISPARLDAVLNAHYFGHFRDDFGVDAAGESKFTPVKALLTTQILEKY